MTLLTSFDEALGSAIGCIPSGLFIIVTRQDSQTATMLASWVQQAAFDPPAVTFAVAKGRAIASALQPGCPLTVNVLEKGSGKLVGHFSKGFEPGIDPLEGLEIGIAPSGQPYLGEALAFLDATVAATLDAGDHDIILARLTAGQRLREGEAAVHSRKNGFRY